MDFYKILKGGVGVGMNNFDRLFAEKYGGGAWQLTTLTGALPLSFKSKGEALTDYKLYGTSEGSGVQTESGEPTGYKLPLTITSGQQSQDYPLYIGSSKLGAEEYVDYETGKVYKRTEIKGLSEPLCGINDYKDTLELSTGALTRRIQKLVLTGEESYTYQAEYNRYVFLKTDAYSIGLRNTRCFCTHYNAVFNSETIANIPDNSIYINDQLSGAQFCIKTTSFTTLNSWTQFLADQYTAGTPVTIWYILKTPTTETITVPSGLTGNIEGYLVQDKTPTPTNPIYPVSNGTKQQDNTYSVYTEITPTDPPVPLPEIATYSGENTLSCSEALGEISITGYIKGV